MPTQSLEDLDFDPSKQQFHNENKVLLLFAIINHYQLLFGYAHTSYTVYNLIHM